MRVRLNLNGVWDLGGGCQDRSYLSPSLNSLISASLSPAANRGRDYWYTLGWKTSGCAGSFLTTISTWYSTPSNQKD